MGAGSHDVEAEAERFVHLLRVVLRRVFALDPEDPTTDLPVAQLRVCTFLSDAARPLSALAKEFGISASAATQVADRLEVAGLVERVADEDDRRVRNLRLTRRGADAIRRRRERRVQSAQELLSALAPGERQTVLDALSALAEAACSVPFGPPQRDEPY